MKLRAGLYLTFVTALVCGGASAVGAPVIVDNTDPGFTVLSGTWETGSSSGKYGANYRFANTVSGPATAEVEWRPTIPAAGTYQVAVYYGAGTNRADNATYIIEHAGGTATVSVNQQAFGSTWLLLGEFTLNAGTGGSVRLSNSANPSVVIADAVRFWEVNDIPITLTVNVGPTGAGTTTPAAGGSYTKTRDEVVSLSAVANAGYVFDHWSIWNEAARQEVTVGAADTTVTMSESKTATAVFRPTTVPPEFRAFWADAFAAGFKSTAQIDTMVSRAVAGNYNAIVAEVMAYQDNVGGGHGAYWNSSILPKATDIVGDIDPLEYLVQKAHDAGIQVHCWLVTYRISLTWPPAGNAYLTAHPELTMVTQAAMGGMGKIAEKYVLDPGSPDAQEYLVSIVRELVTHYAIDGIHWDYIRYEQSDAGYPSDVNYTKSGLARFKQMTDYPGTPPPTGYAPWDDFRRREVTELVRRVRAEVPSCGGKGVQPVRHSGSLITWGDGPSTFTASSAWARFSNWEEWLRLGYLDTGIPMTYYNQQQYPTYFTHWVDKEISWRYQRQLVVGPGVYLNTFGDSLGQMEYARSKGADGLCTYSYASPGGNPSSTQDWYSYIGSRFFTAPAPIPTMPWRDPATATEGTVWGRVTVAAGGEPVDDAVVQVAGLPAVRTDGNGYYVVTLVPAVGAGTAYSVTAGASGFGDQTNGAVVVPPGGVVRADFAMSGQDTRPPMIVGAVTVGDVFDTRATIAWPTDESSNSRVSLGIVSGTYTVQADVADLKKLHSVTVQNLSPRTTYFFVVTSCDASGNCVTSSEGQFATLEAGRIADFIVESRAAGQNYARYSEPDGPYADSSAKSSAAGVTPGSGSRYSSTLNRRAVYAFTPTVSGQYKVFATWGTSTNGGQIDHVATHSGGSSTQTLNQNSSAGFNNKWNLVGTFGMEAGQAYTVTQKMTTAQSGKRVMADAVKWYYVDSVSPTAPTNLTATPGVKAVNLAWSANAETDIDSYDICRSDTPGGPYTVVGSAKGTSYADATVVPATTYYYVVKAVDGSDNRSAASNEAASRPRIDVASVTSDVADGLYGAGRRITIQVVFNGPVILTGILRLQLETGTTDRQAVYAFGGGTNTLTFEYVVQSGDRSPRLDYTSTSALVLDGGTIKDLDGYEAVLILPAPGTTGSLYYNKRIEINGSSAVSAPEILPEPPATPGQSNVIFWKAANGAAQYLVQCAADAAFTSPTESGWTAASQYEFTGLTLGTTYYYRVKARNAEATATSDWSDVTSSLQAERVAPRMIAVTSETPNGTYGTGREINVQVLFDAPVRVLTALGTPRVTLETGAVDRPAEYVGGNETTTIRFLYRVQLGDASSDLEYLGTTALDLHGGSMLGMDGQPVTLTLPAPYSPGSLGYNKDIVIDGQVLPTPTMLAEPAYTPGTENTVTWGLVAGALEYRCVCASDASFTTIVGESGWNAQPGYTFTGLTVGQTYWYRVQAKDDAQISEWSAVVASQQTPQDQAPTAQDQSVNAVTAQALAIQLSSTDPDGGPATTYEIVTPPAHGTVTLDDAATGQVTYTSAAAYTGADSFQFRVFDGIEHSNAATVSITVTSGSTGGGGTGGGGGGGSGPTQYLLTATVLGGHGTVQPATATYAAGTVVTLTAAPDAGYRVKAWTGTGDDTAKTTGNAVAMSGNRVVTVEFEPDVAGLSVVASTDTPVIAAGGSAKLLATVTGGVAPYTFAWAPAEALNNAGSASPTASPAATTAYTVTVTDAAGGSAQAGVTITVTQAAAPPPAAEDNTAAPDDQSTAPAPLAALCGTGVAEGGLLALFGLMCVQARRRW